MPGAMGFLALRGNSFSVSSNHFNWKDLFLSAAGEEKLMSAESQLSCTLVLPSVAASAESTYTIHETSKLQLIRNDSNIFQCFVWETPLFLLMQENVSHHRIVVEPLNKVELKISLFLPTVLNFLSAFKTYY